MKLIITTESIEQFQEIRSLTDQFSMASYPRYSMQTEKDLQWHKPTLVVVGTPNTIYHLKMQLEKRNIKVETQEEKGY